ncbi:MAG TPA: VCBS repeat-containing protein [Actinomycetota bacterium]|nr:VCBS repeat-containing protein [Actinomycetota bacterium]
MNKRCARCLAVLASISTLVVLVVAPPAIAARSLGAEPGTESFSVTVGQRNQPATLSLKNESTSPDHTLSFAVTSLRIAPSCVVASTTNCTTPEPGVISTSDTGSGRPGTACAGITWTFGEPNASGVQTVTPSAPVTLGPTGSATATCIVDFTIDILKMPVADASGALAGKQTLMVGLLSTASTVGGITTNSFRGRTLTVVPARTTSDFDGDARSDIAVYRPAGFWYVNNSGTGDLSATNWGSQGDLPAAADYDADGRTDYAVFRPSTAIWYVNHSTGGGEVVNWGLNGDVPMPGDYDGDRRADIAVFRPSTAIWYVRLSSGGTMTINWGLNGDIPAAGDFDGDGRADIAVFRPSTAIWYIARSLGGVTVVNWGLDGDIPVSGDYDGDGRTDVTVFRPSNALWYVQRSSDGGMTVVNWGADGDTPVHPPPSRTF